jgi:cell wall-associated NlpC family hydrolase
LVGGVIVGAAVIGGITGPWAASPAKAQLGQAAADLVVNAPAGAAAMAAAGAPALPHKAIPDRASAPKQPAPKQAAPKQPAPKQAAAKKKAAAPVASAQDVINLARKQIGIRENSAGITKFQQWYMTTPEARLTVRRDGGSIADYGNAAWCDMFVSWVGHQVGAQGMGEDAYTVAHAEWFQRQGRWGTTPKPGAVVFFAWNGGGTDGIEHVGLVVKENSNGTIDTIEGNTSNAVMERERSTDSVVGYGYPQYAK